MNEKSPETPVAEEIKRIVATAKRDGGCISASASAAWVIRVYPDCGLSEPEVAERIIMAAANAGVAVEMGRMANGDLRSPIT
jgi:hypothetical protein